jgi:hypothetical protein
MNQNNLNKIKNILGIRNKFWRKRFEIIKNHLDILYIKSINKNYLPFRLAFSKTILQIEKKPNELDIENFYNSSLVEYLNKLNHQTFILEENQKARKVSLKNKIYINITNPDGLEDPIKRKTINEINQKILNYIYSNQDELIKKNHKELNYIFINILQPNLYKIFNKEEFNLIRDFIESPIGKILNNFIPGLSILLEIQKQKEALKENDLIKLSSTIVINRVKELTQRLIYMLTENFIKKGKYIAPPLVAITSIAFERYESYKRCQQIVDQNYQKILLIYNKIQQNKLNEEKLIDNFYENHPQEIKKLLDS